MVAKSGLNNTNFWTRSVYPNNTNNFVNVNSDGSHNNNNPNNAYSVLP